MPTQNKNKVVVSLNKVPKSVRIERLISGQNTENIWLSDDKIINRTNTQSPPQIQEKKDKEQKKCKCSKNGNTVKLRFPSRSQAWHSSIYSSFDYLHKHSTKLSMPKHCHIKIQSSQSPMPSQEFMLG